MMQYRTHLKLWLIGWFILTTWVLGALGISCAHVNSNDQSNTQLQAQKQASCIKLANDCFEGMYKLQEDKDTIASMAQSCLWNWQAWKCHELVHENVNGGYSVNK